MDTDSDGSLKQKHYCTYEGCKAAFIKNSKLQYHIRRHTGERPFVCDEPNCHKTYLYSFHLKRHKEVYHLKTSVGDRIACPHEGCYLELANKYSLKKHIKRKHNPERIYPVSCNICHQGFFKKRQLLRHSYVHTGVLPYKCEKCDTRFPGLFEKNRHMRTHTTYICLCGNTFERWSELLQHRKACGKKHYTCKVCDQTFKKASNLQSHLKLHFSDGLQNFYCGYDNCQRVYRYKNNLISHIKQYHKHIEKARVYCGYQNCNVGFTRKQTLILHIDRVHRNIKPLVKRQRATRKDKGTFRTDIKAVLVGLPTSSNITTIHLNKPHSNLLCNNEVLVEGFKLLEENCLKTI